jgi:hypothetical protein
MGDIARKTHEVVDKVSRACDAGEGVELSADEVEALLAYVRRLQYTKHIRW